MKSGLVDYEVIAFDPSRFHPDFSSFIREPERVEIELVPYTTEWESLFKEEAEILSETLGETLVTLHHIGSTAIPGIVAKPILDILPVVKDIQAIDHLTDALQTLGYEGRGEFGMPGRRFFMKTVAGKRHVNVHIFEKGHPDILRHLLFRDYLKNHAEDAFAYSELKKKLVLESQNDIERYCWGKEDFVKAIEIKASLRNVFLNKVES
ncbi:MAG: GrpB family protein [Alphaproteobacteria bacterium]|nr:GrpB family protein [Alphaproteobacteria bacterium]